MAKWQARLAHVQLKWENTAVTSYGVLLTHLGMYLVFPAILLQVFFASILIYCYFVEFFAQV